MRVLRGCVALIPVVLTLASCGGDSGDVGLVADSIDEALALAAQKNTHVVVKYWDAG